MFCFRSDNKLRYRSVFAFVSISLTLLLATQVTASVQFLNWVAAIGKTGAIHVNQSASMNKLLSRWKQFYARYKIASPKKNKKKHGDQTTFHYLSFKPSLDPPSDWLDNRFKLTYFFCWINVDANTHDGYNIIW